ncbi:MAG: UPF0280 family protein [Methylobacteriaceae bacterium]|nr:UPF0280 family protein [Methylobacteriaceae bacterium]
MTAARSLEGADPARRGLRLQARLLPDGRRLHLQDGPIDLVVRADGPAEAVAAAYAAASARFGTILDELCTELPLLRRAARPGERPGGRVAARMHDAALPLASLVFLTPMAAVAGAVADEILDTMQAAAPLERVVINNGGDVALALGPGQSLRLGLVDRPDRPNLFATAILRAEDGIGGVATSGWRGRSFSLGVADAVTILGVDAAAADAAATVVANAVDLPDHPAITRVPANTLQPESDLGTRLVTRGVGRLAPGEIAEALERGEAVARDLVARGLMRGAALHLAGETRIVGAALAEPTPAPPDRRAA